MEPIHSKITSQGQVTIPVEIRRRLGLAPGSIIEWREVEGQVVLDRPKTYSSLDIHEAVFPEITQAETSQPTSLEEMHSGIRERARRKYARD